MGDEVMNLKWWWAEGKGKSERRVGERGQRNGGHWGSLLTGMNFLGLTHGNHRILQLK